MNFEKDIRERSTRILYRDLKDLMFKVYKETDVTHCKSMTEVKSVLINEFVKGAVSE